MDYISEKEESFEGINTAINMPELEVALNNPIKEHCDEK